jgi:polyhydroxybutyrate depolymerase
VMTRSRWAASTLAVLVASAVACGKAATDSPTDGGPHGSSSSSGGGYGSSGGGEGVDATLGGGDAAGPELDAGAASDASVSQADGATSVQCGETFLAPGDYTRTLTIDGGARTYYVHIPPGAVGPGAAPLVFALHGGGMTVYGDGGLGFELFAHVRAKSDTAGFVLIEPEGTPALPLSQPGVLDVFNAGNCCEEAEQKNSNIDDVGFVSAMIDAISLETCIDPKRVFATGLSNGAMLSHRLACQLSDRIAAIAAVSGGMGNRDLDTLPSPTTLFECNPTRPVPILHIHGTQDACYPFDGGWGPLSLLTFEAVPVTIADWVTRNGCSAGEPTKVFTNGAASCFLYPCPDAGQVELCEIDGGGHYWPGGDDWAGSEFLCGSNQGVRSSDIIANDAMWSWFQTHPM